MFKQLCKIIVVVAEAEIEELISIVVILWYSQVRGITREMYFIKY